MMVASCTLSFPLGPPSPADGSLHSHPCLSVPVSTNSVPQHRGVGQCLGGTTPSGIPALEDTQMCLLNAQLHNSNYLNVE